MLYNSALLKLNAESLRRLKTLTEKRNMAVFIAAYVRRQKLAPGKKFTTELRNFS
jgi:hypothetical protein